MSMNILQDRRVQLVALLAVLAILVAGGIVAAQQNAVNKVDVKIQERSTGEVQTATIQVPQTVTVLDQWSMALGIGPKPLAVDKTFDSQELTLKQGGEYKIKYGAYPTWSSKNLNSVDKAVLSETGKAYDASGQKQSMVWYDWTGTSYPTLTTEETSVPMDAAPGDVYLEPTKWFTHYGSGANQYITGRSLRNGYMEGTVTIHYTDAAGNDLTKDVTLKINLNVDAQTSRLTASVSNVWVQTE